MDSVEELQNELKQIVMARLDLTKDMKDEEVLNVIDDVIIETGKKVFMKVQLKNRLRYQIFNSIRKLDVLQELIDDRNITEIMINGSSNIFIEKNGKLSKWEKKFESKERYEDIVQQIVSRANRAVNEANPIVDARLMDGSRVNVVMEPIALDGTTMTIRKFPEHPMTVEQLLAYKSITKEVAQVLEKLVIAKYNIFISGGTGSGKTTFLNALSNFIPSDERIITIEDSAELQIRNIPNLVRLEMRNNNVEGKNGVSIRDLIKSSLRMRPDRIIVGEVRDGAAIDMLTALNTGHDGSLSTGHANSPSDMLSRLETLVLLNSEIPLLAVRKQIASAIDIIVHLGRLRDKSRHVLEIVEVLDCIDNEIKVNPLYIFEETGVDAKGKIIGELKRTEFRLQNSEKLSRAGVTIDDQL